MGFGSRRLTTVPLLNARHRTARLVWAREHRDWSVDDWKRGVVCSDESGFRLHNVDGSLRIWRQAHEPCMPGWNCTRTWWLNHGLGCFFVVLFGIFGACTYLYQCNFVRRNTGRSPPSVYAVLGYPHGNRVFQQDNCTSHKPGWLLSGWMRTPLTF
ncbi:uncharacterized protein TNCV_426461 [Trichonephila clavipes]|nr:uncharacterized protein TNCV_426461 [Trichonephila clavipes]